MLTARDFKEIVSGQRKGIGASLLRGTLWLASLGYGIGMSVRNRRYDSQAKPSEKIDVPVISVGNLTLGGTGKTPLVAWLARWFRERDFRVTLISRGYGAEQGTQNDEALELEQLLPDVPHLQNPDRVAAAKVAAEELAAQVLLLDDAFQHRRIARDLDIVLIDATAPFGYGYLFPRGTLREPTTSLRRADVIALTRGDMVSDGQRQAIWEQIRKLDLDATLVEMRHQPSRLLSASSESADIDSLRGQKVLAFCGIGNPSGFRHTLTQAGMEVVELREFDDHYHFDGEDVSNLQQWVAQHDDIAAVICTHKDLVKVGVDRLAEKPLWALIIEANIVDGQAELEQRLEEIVMRIPDDPYADY
ncbi:tetraacyldisaccharide 4'-kinase [Bremerella cremea]|uniref:Tetraacyldisaccharide 4'-kinase n=1 Tax=Bremerella cremea TaxID=1031537 RepID=A0A368KRB2_9BACT|nr:tetraacyldisaccharide 4'-kinase [Bremerella cremea]RCS49383.1 tetraacyldisaccharide 4'-kinase [Bremerella cremea]